MDSRFNNNGVSVWTDGATTVDQMEMARIGRIQGMSKGKKKRRRHMSQIVEDHAEA